MLVNQALVDRFFPGRDPIGTRIRLGPNPKAAWRTIVGVIGNVRQDGPEHEPVPEAFSPLTQDTFGDLTLVVRADGDPSAIAATVRSAAHSVDPRVVLWRMKWMDDIVDAHLAPRRLVMRLVQGFAATALLLALLGIYGALSFSVSHRVPEIGVRMALGADPGRIRAMIVRDGLRVAVPGLALGGLVAFGAAHMARAMLFQVSPADPAAFAGVAVGTLVVAVAASYLPARRAASIDPLSAIRE